MIQRTAFRCLAPAMALAIVIAIAPSVGAQQADDQSDDAEALRYLRVEVPNDQAERWPRFGYRFESLPLTIEQFQQLLDSAQSGRRSGSPTEPRISNIELTATLLDDVLTGSGTMQVQYDGKSPAFASLADCKIAITDAVWDDEENSAVALGSGANGQLVLAVQNSGRVEFNWSLRGRRDSTGVLRLDLALPDAVHRSLALAVPKEYQVFTADVSTQQKVDDAKLQRYQIDLSGGRSTQLLLIPTAVADAASGPVLVRQANTYAISESGFTLSTRFDLQVLNRPFTNPTINIRVDQGLQPVNITLNGQAASWNINEAGDELQIRVAQPLSPQGNHQLVVEGIGPLKLGEAAVLPTLRTDKVEWLSRKSTITIARGLTLQKLDINGGQLTRLSDTPSNNSGVQLELQFDDEQGHAILSIARQQPQATIDQVFAWKIGEDQIEGHLNATLQSPEGSIHKVDLHIAPHWSLKEQDLRVVATSDSDDQAPRVIPHRLTSVAPNNTAHGQTARLELTLPVTPKQSARLEMTARYNRELPPESFPFNDLLFTEFPGLKVTGTVAALSTVAPLAVELRAQGDLQMLSVDNLDDATREWLVPLSPAIVVKSSNDTGDARVRLVQAAPRIRTRIHSRALLRSDSVAESYLVRCTPDAAGLTQLRISCWPPQRANLHWAFSEDVQEAGVNVRRLEASEEAETEAGQQPEVWEINFGQRLSKPFEFSAHRVREGTDEEEIPLCLLSVVGATIQQGRVLVVGDRNVALSVVPNNMQPVSPSAAELEVADDEVVWAAYRYSPTPAVAPLDAGIAVKPGNASHAHTFAWRMLLLSDYGAGRSTLHRATWWVNNQGRGAIQVTLPTDATVKSIAVNDQQICHTHQSNIQHIHFTQFSAEAVVSVEFTTKHDPLGMWESLAAPQLEIDIPVLDKHWRVTPPPGYQLRQDEQLAPQFVALSATWLHPLGMGNVSTSHAVTEPRAAIDMALSSEGATVTLYHVMTIGGCALALMLAAAGFAIWLRPLPLRWLLAAGLLVAATALLLSDPWRLLAWASVVGIVVGIAWRLTVRTRRPSRMSTNSRRAGSLTTASTALVIISIFGNTQTTTAQEANQQESTRPPTVYPLWYPVDGDGKSTGYVHLPRPFLAALNARAEANALPSRDWLIDRADYHVQFQWQAVDERLDLRALEIDLDIQVIEDVTEVTLPLARDDAALLDEGATLNGELIELNWILRQPTLTIPVNGRGRHRLILHLRPSTATNANYASVRFGIPPIPGARLTITAPPGAPRINVDECLGAIATTGDAETEGVTIAAELGAVDSLSLNWQPQRSLETPPTVSNLQKLVWLKSGTEPPTMEAKFRGTIDTMERAGELTHLLIQADAALTLLRGDAKLVESNHPTLKTYRVAVTRNEATAQADIAFQLPPRPMAGRFALPVIDVAETEIKSCWVAMNATLGTDIVAATGLKAMEPTAFIERWGEEQQTPQRAFECDVAAEVVLLSITPQQDLPKATETLAYLFSAADLTIDYEAKIAGNLNSKQHQIFHLPSGMSIDSVIAELTTSDATPSRDNVAWWAVRDNQLNVFLRQPPTQPYRLLITGSIPTPNFGRMKLPTIHLSTANVTDSQLNIRRKSNVLVNLVRHNGFALLPLDDETPSDPAAWPVARLQADLSKTAPKSRNCLVQTRPNRPVAAGRQIIQLLRRDASWDLMIDVDVRVRQGQLDQLQWEIPAALAESISLDEHAFSIEPTLEDNRRLLTIIPTTPIDDDFHIRIIAADIIALGQDVALPDLSPVSDINFLRYVAVPATFENRNIAWETDGLQPISAELLGDQLGPSASDTRLFQVVSDSHHATLRSFTEVTGVALVALADVYFAWDVAGNSFARALLDLEPAGLTSCVVEVPPHQRITHARIDDLPVQVDQLSPQRWRLKLLSTKLPQRIEVLYSGESQVDRSALEVQAIAPVLTDIAVQRTLWTIYAPPAAGQAITSSSNLSAAQLDAIRLRSLADLIRLPRHLRLEYSSSETQDWLRPWQHRYGQQRRAATAASSALEDIDFNYRHSLQELEVPEAILQDIFVTHSPTDTAWQTLVADQNIAARHVVKGASRQMQIRFEPATGTSVNWPRYVGAFAAFCAALLALTSPRWLPAGDWPVRYGPAIASTVAILAATFILPSVLLWSAFLIIIVAVIWWRRTPSNDPLREAILVRSTSTDDSTT